MRLQFPGLNLTMTVQLRNIPASFLICRSVRYLLVLRGLQAIDLPTLTGPKPASLCNKQVGPSLKRSHACV